MTATSGWARSTAWCASTAIPSPRSTSTTRPGLPDNGIVFLFEDSQSNLWVGTANGRLVRHPKRRGATISTAARAGTHHLCLRGCRRRGLVLQRRGPPFLLAEWPAGSPDQRPDAGVRTRNFSTAPCMSSSREKTASSGSLQNGRVAKIPQGDAWKKILAPARGPARRFRLSDRSAILTPSDQCRRHREDRDGNLVVGTLGAGIFWLEPRGWWQPHHRHRTGLRMDFVLSLVL